MAADQTIVNAAFKYGESTVGLDKSKYYKDVLQSRVDTMKNIANAFQEKTIANEQAWEAIAGSTEEMMNSLASEDQLGSMGAANIAHLKTLKKEFIRAGDNKDKQNEVKIKIQKVVKTINKLAGGFSKYGEAYLDDTLDRQASDPEFTNILGRIWERDDVYDDTQFNWTDSGDLEIIVDGQVTNSNQLFDKLIVKNDETMNGLGSLGMTMEKRGVDGLEISRGENVESVKSLWSGAKGKSNFATTINSSTFGSASFLQALVNNEGIHKTLEGLNKFDNNGDGKVNSSDFATDENKQKLIESLTNVHSDIFDFETAKQVAAEWYNDSYLQSKYDDGVSARKKTSNNNGDGGGLPFDNDQSYGKTGDYTSGSILNAKYDDIKNRNNFYHNGVTARAGKTGWEIDQEEDGKTVTSEVTTSQLMAIMKLNFYQFNKLKNNDPFSAKSDFDFSAGVPESGVLKKEFQTKK